MIGIIALLSAWFHTGERGGTGFPGALAALPELRASLKDGDYLFFPNRRNIWVVNSRSGRIRHYKFLDTAEGTVERSHVGLVDQRIFPPEDTVYAISERNAADLLWVCNHRTGDFQLWRRNVRDGRLITDPTPVPGSQDLSEVTKEAGEDEEPAQPQPGSSKTRPASRSSQPRGK
ncbi:MAG: hypothetical protein HY717_00235 [Planctomycetes bacterium]|nr:hypothetical protein [Planctomycetota bacterium]